MGILEHNMRRKKALETKLSRLEQRQTCRPQEQPLLDSDPRNFGFATLLTVVLGLECWGSLNSDGGWTETTYLVVIGALWRAILAFLVVGLACCWWGPGWRIARAREWECRAISCGAAPRVRCWRYCGHSTPPHSAWRAA